MTCAMKGMGAGDSVLGPQHDEMRDPQHVNLRTCTQNRFARAAALCFQAVSDGSQPLAYALIGRYPPRHNPYKPPCDRPNPTCPSSGRSGLPPGGNKQLHFLMVLLEGAASASSNVRNGQRGGEPFATLTEGQRAATVGAPAATCRSAGPKPSVPRRHPFPGASSRSRSRSGESSWCGNGRELGRGCTHQHLELPDGDVRYRHLDVRDLSHRTAGQQAVALRARASRVWGISRAERLTSSSEEHATRQKE